jgi:hypothetical protein
VTAGTSAVGSVAGAGTVSLFPPLPYIGTESKSSPELHLLSAPAHPEQDPLLAPVLPRKQPLLPPFHLRLTVIRF